MKKITDGIAQLELSLNMGGHEMVIHPTLIWDDKDVILVDTGIPGMVTEIREEMERAGVSLDSLSKVILTHQDVDHIGGLPEILSTAQQPIEVLAHELDKPYIEGEKPLIKWDPSRGPAPLAEVDTLVQDGEVLPYLGGLTVIFTPGHTPGHISLYHAASKTLITGDAMVSNEGKVVGFNEAYTPDKELAWKSIAKFTNFDVETVLCYHGGICNQNVNEQIAALVAQRV